jgi:hypothetical protein
MRKLAVYYEYLAFILSQWRVKFVERGAVDNALALERLPHVAQMALSPRVVYIINLEGALYALPPVQSVIAEFKQERPEIPLPTDTTPHVFQRAMHTLTTTDCAWSKLGKRIVIFEGDYSPMQIFINLFLDMEGEYATASNNQDLADGSSHDFIREELAPRFTWIEENIVFSSATPFPFFIAHTNVFLFGELTRFKTNPSTMNLLAAWFKDLSRYFGVTLFFLPCVGGSSDDEQSTTHQTKATFRRAILPMASPTDITLKKQIRIIKVHTVVAAGGRMHCFACYGLWLVAAYRGRVNSACRRRRRCSDGGRHIGDRRRCIINTCERQRREIKQRRCFR